MTVAQVTKQNIFWRTPKGDSPLDSTWTVNKLIEKFDLKLDPCCSGIDDCLVPPEKGGYFFTPDDDGLSQPWKDNTIFNPPFAKPALEEGGGEPKLNDKNQIIYTSAIGDWCKKAIEEAIKNKIIVIGILPWYGDSWFQKYVWDILPKSNIILLDKRVSYLDSDNNPIHGNRFSTFLALWDQRTRR